MKTLNIATVLLLALGLSVTALAQTSDGPDEVTKTIAAQVQVTSDQLRNLVEKAAEIRGSPLSDADYDQISAGYRQTVENALLKYEEGMKTSILPKIQRILAQYKVLSRGGSSSGFAESNRDQAQRQVNLVWREYSTLIGNVFHAVLNGISQSAVSVVAVADEARCGYYSLKVKETRRGLSYSDRVEFNFSRAYDVTKLNWHGQSAVVGTKCVLGKKAKVHTHGGNSDGEEKNGLLTHDYYYGVTDLVFYKNGKLAAGPMPFESSMEWQRDLLDFRGSADGSGYISRPRTWMSNSPLSPSATLHSEFSVTQEIASKWLTSCKSQMCKQLRLGDLDQFLTEANAKLNRSLEFKLPDNTGTVTLSNAKISVTPLKATVAEMNRYIDNF